MVVMPVKCINPMVSLCVIPVLFSLSVIVFSPIVSAELEGIAGDSSIGLELAKDEEGGRDTTINFDTFVDDIHQFKFTYGTHKSSSEEKALDTSVFTAGFEEVSDGVVDIGMTMGYWGNPDELTSTTVEGLVRINWHDLSLTFSPQVRRIRFENVIVDVQDPTRTLDIDLNSEGMMYSLNYIFNKSFYINVARENYRFFYNDFEILLIRRDYLFRLRANASRTTALSFENYRNTVLFGITSDWADFTLGISRGESVLNEKLSTQRTLSMSKSLSNTLLLNLQIGELEEEAGSSLTFGSIALTHYW